MADPFLGEIRIFTFNYAPRGWAQCNGQLLPVSQNTALFSLLGTAYGGNGTTTFALPDLQARTPMFWGQGAGLSAHSRAETGGAETVTLMPAQMPAHSHAVPVGGISSQNDPAANRILGRSAGVNIYAPSANLQAMAPQSLTDAGASSPHNNLMPYLTVNFCIALQGISPQ